MEASHRPTDGEVLMVSWSQRFFVLAGALAFFLLGLQDVDAANNLAQPQKGYVTLKDGVQRYVEFTPPQGQKPTVVLINGLVYNIDRWTPFADFFKSNGYGVLSYDMRGQCRTLLKESDDHKTPAFFATGLQTDDLANELNSLLISFRLESVVVIGLSYGASVAAEFARLFPAKVSQLIFLAPLVRPLEKYEPQGAWLDWNLDQIRLWWGPFFGPAFYDAAYNQIYRTYLTQRIVPISVPVELKDRPDVYRESIFHLVRATRDFDLTSNHFEALRPESVHFILAKEDKPAIFNDQVNAYNGVSRSKGTLIFMQNADHAIPDSQGARAAGYVDLLLKQDPRMHAGGKYIDTDKGLVVWK
jgi:pimeloyl-ACP methyl ester carboxylesterase